MSIEERARRQEQKKAEQREARRQRTGGQIEPLGRSSPDTGVAPGGDAGARLRTAEAHGAMNICCRFWRSPRTPNTPSCLSGRAG